METNNHEEKNLKIVEVPDFHWNNKEVGAHYEALLSKIIKRAESTRQGGVARGIIENLVSLFPEDKDQFEGLLDRESKSVSPAKPKKVNNTRSARNLFAKTNVQTKDDCEDCGDDVKKAVKEGSYLTPRGNGSKTTATTIKVNSEGLRPRPRVTKVENNDDTGENSTGDNKTHATAVENGSNQAKTISDEGIVKGEVQEKEQKLPDAFIQKKEATKEPTIISEARTIEQVMGFFNKTGKEDTASIKVNMRAFMTQFKIELPSKRAGVKAHAEKILGHINTEEK